MYRADSININTRTVATLYTTTAAPSSYLNLDREKPRPRDFSSASMCTNIPIYIRVYTRVYKRVRKALKKTAQRHTRARDPVFTHSPLLSFLFYHRAATAAAVAPCAQFREIRSELGRGGVFTFLARARMRCAKQWTREGERRAGERTSVNRLSPRCADAAGTFI